MSEHRHDESRLVVHRVTWENHPREKIEDAYVTCVSCLDELGFDCVLVSYPFDEREELPPEDVWEIAAWDPDEYPYDAHAKPGDVCYRPEAGDVPSMREIWFRRGEEPPA